MNIKLSTAAAIAHLDTIIDSLAQEPLPLCSGKQAMNLALMDANTVRGLGVIFLLGVLFLMQAAAQPRISMNVQRLDFKGNLVRLADGSLVAEKKGQLYRLTPDAQFERKLEFDPTRPFDDITGGQTEFSQLLAPLKSGGFLASVNFNIPGFGWIERRLAAFDAEGRLVSSFDTSGTSIASAVESLNVSFSTAWITLQGLWTTVTQPLIRNNGNTRFQPDLRASVLPVAQAILLKKSLKSPRAGLSGKRVS